MRDIDKREVGFLVTVGGKPWFAVEAKLKDAGLSPLLYFKERLSTPYIYQAVKKTAVDTIEKDQESFQPGNSSPA